MSERGGEGRKGQPPLALSPAEVIFLPLVFFAFAIP